VSEEVTPLEEAINKVRDGGEVTNEQALLLCDAIRDLELALTVQRTLVSVFTQTVPDMAQSLAASVLSRTGRTDQKIRRSVSKICDAHIDSLRDLTIGITSRIFEEASKEVPK
jgi:hypothetical protein